MIFNNRNLSHKTLKDQALVYLLGATNGTSYNSGVQSKVTLVTLVSDTCDTNKTPSALCDT